MSTGLRKVPYTVFSPLLEVYFFRPPSWFTLRDEPATTAYKNTLPKESKKLAQENFSQIVLHFIIIQHFVITKKNKILIKMKEPLEKSFLAFFDSFGSVFL